MINVDAAVAWLVLIVLFGTLFGIIWWTKDAPPYDDGVGGQWADYLPEPLEDEGWAEPPPRTKPPWERDEPGARPGEGEAAAALEGSATADAAADPTTGPEERGSDGEEGA